MPLATSDLDAIEWREGRLAEVLRFLEVFEKSWWLAGGLALDTWLGRETRSHGDVDITLFRRDVAGLFDLSDDLEFYLADKGRLKKVIHSHELKERDWNLWIKKKEEDHWFFQSLIADENEGEWVYRRNPKIKRAKKDFEVRSKEGVPLIAPEIQLLYKSALNEPKDQTDFENILLSLDNKQRQWLKESLKLTDPNHQWLTHLNH